MNIFITTQPSISHEKNYSKQLILYWRKYWDKFANLHNINYDNILHIPLSVITYHKLNDSIKNNYLYNKEYDVILFVSPHAIKSYAINYNIIIAREVWLIGKKSHKIFNQYFGDYCYQNNIKIIFNEEQQDSSGLWIKISSPNKLKKIKNILVVKNNKGNDELYKKISNINSDIDIDYLYSYEANYLAPDIDIIHENNLLCANQIGVYISSSDILQQWHLFTKDLTLAKTIIYVRHQRIADKFYIEDKFYNNYSLVLLS